MKYLIPIFTLLCFLLLIGIFYTLTGEINSLKARDTIHTNKIRALEDKIDLCTKEKKALIAEVREITRPITRLIVVNEWVLGVRKEKGDKNDSSKHAKRRKED